MTSCVSLKGVCCLRFGDEINDNEEENLPISFCGVKQHDRIICPGSIGNRAWQGLIATVALIGTGIATAQASFTTDSLILWIVVYLFDVLFTLDIVLNFYLAYFKDNGILVADRRKIVMRYLRGPFALDLLCVFPLDFLALVINTRSMARSLAFLRLNRIIKIHKCFAYFGK